MDQPNPEKTLKVVHFGAFSFDRERSVLHKQGRTIHLRPQAARLLAVLLESPDTLVERDRLREAVWGSRVVEWEMGLHRLVRDVRLAIGDDPRNPRYLQTVARRGYRFRLPQSDRTSHPPSDRVGRTIRWYVAGLLSVPFGVLAFCLYIGLSS